MDRPVNVAVIGAGYWGPNLIRNLSATPATHLSWVCDVDLERAKRSVAAWGEVKTTVDVSEVFADPTVEAVAIATPAASHADVALRAIDAGKHVLIEKPLARSMEEGHAIVERARTRNVAVMVDHTFCYTAPVRKIRDIVRSGELGDVLFFDSVRINLGLIQQDIDVFWDLAPHDLSILDFILPPEARPLQIAAHAADPLGIGHACTGYLVAHLANGAIAHAHVNWLSPTKIRTTIIGGTRKMVVWDDLHPSQKISIHDSGVALNEETVGEEARRDTLVSYRVGDIVAPALPSTEALRLVVEEFAAAIRMGRPALTDGLAGLRVLAMLAAVEQSLRKGGALVEVADLLGGAT
jgi:predicted dehydrogenase